MQDLILTHKILSNIYKSEAFASIELTKYINEAKNRELVTKMVYGVLERDVELEFHIGRLVATRPQNPVVIVLKIGMYCIKYLDSIPDYAAVSKSVDLCKNIGKMSVAGFVNATLKRFCKEKNVLPKNDLNKLSVETSTPLWLIKEYIMQYGLEKTSLMLKIKEFSFEHIRVNLLRYSMDELKKVIEENNLEFVEDDFESIYTKYKLPIKKLYDDGKVTIQSKTSMECAKAMDAKDNENILDLCSAPGGKSVYMASHANCKIVACDIHEHRLNLIRGYASRLGVKNIDVKLNDATILNTEFINKFDKVLCDVPCSGLGVSKKKPDIYLGLTMDKIMDLTKVQYKILQTAKNYVKVNGMIVYSTCTTLKQENKNIVDKFLSENKNFKLVDDKQYLMNNNGQDGFYVARLVRVSK